MKKAVCTIIIFALVLCILSGCGTKAVEAPASQPPADDGRVVLSGESAAYSGRGMNINGNVLSINAGGEYTFTGTLTNGQIIVDAGNDPADVYIILDNASVTCLTAPAIYILQAEKVHVVTLKGTDNALTSGTPADAENYNENAAGGVIFSEDDLDIEGEGNLSIAGYINNGITCKDDFQMQGGSVAITAVNNGIKASESAKVEGGNLNITCRNDGIKATSAKKEGKGFVEVSGGNVNIQAGGDGISAETELRVTGGNINVLCDGNPELGSCKAMKAKTGIIISDGNVCAVSPDHAVHSTARIDMSGGTLSAVSGMGKAVSAHSDVSISGGSVVLSSTGNAFDVKGQLSVTGGSIIGAGGAKAADVSPAEGSYSVIAAEISGEEGDHIVFSNGGTVIAEMYTVCPYNSVICIDSAITAGEKYTVSAGGADIETEAR